MNDLSNLPPGVSVGDIPGNRAEDVEIEVLLILTQEDIENIRNYAEAGKDYGLLQDSLKFIIEQLDDEDCDAEFVMNNLVAKNFRLACENGALKRTIKQLRNKYERG